MIFAVLYLIISLFVSYKKPHMALSAICIHYFILMWVSLRFDPSGYSYMGISGVLFIYIATLIYFLNLKTYNKDIVSFISKFYLFFFFYLFIFSLYHSVPLVNYLQYFRNYFHYFLLIPMVLYIYKTNSFKIPLFIILGIVCFQIIISVIQEFYPPIRTFLFVEFINRGEGLERLIAEAVVIGNSSIGTFIRPANLGNFLAIFIPAIYYLQKRKIIMLSNVAFIIIGLLSTYVLVKTGIRTSLISFLIMFFGCQLVLNRKRFFLIGLGSYVLVMITSSFLFSLSKDYGRSQGFQNPFLRLLSLLNPLSDNGSIVEDSTLSRTENILKYLNDFWFGNSTVMSGGYYNGLSSLTDATLGVTLVEFGFITFIIIFIPFVYPLRILYKQSKRAGFTNFKFLLVLFIGILAQTVTDQGFFTAFAAIPYFTISGILIAKSKKTLPNLKNEIYNNYARL